MRVLLLHNRYRAQGGEERVVAMQAELLARHGHAVEVLERDSSTARAARAAAGMLGGGLAPAQVAGAVRRFRADVVHAHNVHPLFGWRALAAARDAGATTLLQLHNFRLFCAIGIAYRDSRPCHECRGLNTLGGLIHRCRGSTPEAAVYAAGLAAQQRRLLGGADRLIALSQGHLALLRGHGLAADGVSVVPNFIADGGWAQSSAAGAGTYALVAGRLVEEKGFDTAVVAAAAAAVPLVVAGAGPDEPRLRALAASTGAEVRFTGWLEPGALAETVRGAGVALIPSRCEEAFGYGALDAFAAGVPVIAAPGGGLADLVSTGAGTLVNSDDATGWADALAALWSDPARRQADGERALAAVRGPYGEAAALTALLGAYRTATAARTGGYASPAATRRIP
jgi:glycosyltransferase involved in cell wall biosynthesis